MQKVKTDYVKIENLPQYLTEIKQIHPDSPQYLPYWKDLKKKCIEGFWGYESGVHNNGVAGYRFCPGRLFFYGNFCTILDVDEEQNTRHKITPDIRDIEWERSYMVLEARGFSGWSNDEVHTSDQAIKNPERVKYNRHGDISKRYLDLFNSNGELKTFISPKQNIRKLHDKPMGSATYWNSASNVFELGARGGGKCLSINEKCFTDSGFKSFNELSLKDKVYNHLGELNSIKSIYDNGVQDVYKIKFDDKTFIECTSNHKWLLASGEVKETKELTNKDRLIKINPIPFEEKDLKIPPYYLGLWLGDGNSHNTGVCTVDKEIKNYLFDVAEKFNLHIQPNSNKNKTAPTYNLNISGGNRFKTNPLKDLLRSYDLLMNKHIPDIYLKGSIHQRFELLKGLMDTDGSIDKRGRIEFYTTLPRLRDGIIELCRTLGIKCYYNVKPSSYKKNGVKIKCKDCYRVIIKTNEKVFKLKRKLNRQKINIPDYKRIKSIEHVGKEKTWCIEVDSADHIFLTTNYVPTHNSYYYALAVAKYELIFNGVKYYTDYNIKNKPKAEVCVGAGQQAKSADFMKKIYDSMQQLALNEKLGVWGKPGKSDYMPCPFHKEMAGSIKPNNKDNKYRHEYKVLENGAEFIKGTGSYIAHVIYSINKPDGAEAAAGGRYNIVIYEECGLLPLLREAWGSNNATTIVGSKQFGTQIALGTSGNMETILPAKEIFTHPKQYRCLGYNDDWEESGMIGFFLPAYMTVRDFKDRDGNTDIEAAIEYFYSKRSIAESADNPHILQIEKMNYPLVPSDMWQSNKGNILPVQEAEQREKVLMKGKLYQKVGTNIKLYKDTSQRNEVGYTVENNAMPFYEHKYKYERTDLSGTITIFEFPQTINGVIPKDMYWISHDPYVSDNIDEGDSLGASYVLLNPKYVTDGFNGNTIVASYIGKPYNGRKEYYNNLENLIAFYGNPNRGLWFEANRGDECKNYFVNRDKEYLLALRPQRVHDSTIHTKRVTQYGFMVSRQSKVELLDKFHDWLLETTSLSDGNKMNIERIPCIFLIRQIQAFTLEHGNYDALSAFLGMMVAIKENEFYIERDLINKNKKNPLSFLSQNKQMFNEYKY